MLFHKIKLSSFVRFPRELGITPFKWLKLKSKLLRLRHPAQSAGMEPLKKLSWSLSSCSKEPEDGQMFCGISPLILFEERSSNCSFEQLRIPDGNGPVNLFVSRRRRSRFCKFPRELGNSPLNSLIARDMSMSDKH